MTYNERINHLNDCLSAKSREIQQANFIRRASFSAPTEACVWAEAGNAHAAFSAFCHDGRSILVQPNPDGQYWFWTEDRCPISSRPLPYHYQLHEREFIIPDTRPEVDTLPGRAFIL